MHKIQNNLEEVEGIVKKVKRIKGAKEIIIEENLGVRGEELSSASDGQDRI